MGHVTGEEGGDNMGVHTGWYHLHVSGGAITTGVHIGSTEYLWKSIKENQACFYCYYKITFEVKVKS